MTRIAAGQSWGVSAASDSRVGWALKKLLAAAQHHRAVVHQQCWQVTSGTHRYLVAVLSDGNTWMTGGIAAVEGAGPYGGILGAGDPLTAQEPDAVDRRGDGRLDDLLILRCGYGERLPRSGRNLQVKLFRLSV
jgi:hypothetical protein